MRFRTCPAVKKYKDFGGELTLHGIRLFSVGQADLFSSTLRILLPAAEITNVSSPEEANVRISVSHAFSPQSEYCLLRITDTGVEIHCRDNAGARNAAAVAAQLASPVPGGFTLPCGMIEDWPDAAYRAMMLESSGRAWMPMEHLMRHIREMALARMNVLQFHFMEHNGCTVPLECLPDFPGYGSENLKYTREEIDRMIGYAASLGITVTPFVEILSHATSLAKCAGITCPGDTEENMFAVCVGQEKTFSVIREVLAEIAAIFPDDIIHIGADEYDMSAVTPYTAHWDKCPECRRLAAEKGFATLRELFVYAIGRINRIVNGLGKVMMMWNADMRPGHLPDSLDRNIIMHFYRSDNTLCREKIFDLSIGGYAAEGFSVINSYFPLTYMDFDFYMSAEKLSSWTHLTNPLVPAENRASVPGGCCCAWEAHGHYIRSISAAILLFADRLWNAFGSPAVYDNEYGTVMTRILFSGALPADMNVFACIGTVLPPLNEKTKVSVYSIAAPECELIRTEKALRVLAENGDWLAGAYADAVSEAGAELRALPAEFSPQAKPTFFIG